MMIDLAARIIGHIVLLLGGVTLFVELVLFICGIIYKRGGHSKEFVDYLIKKRRIEEAEEQQRELEELEEITRNAF